MMRRGLSVLCAALILGGLLTLPVSAATVLTQDTFTKEADSSEKWVADRYEPEEWDVSDGVLYMALGSSGYYRNRPEDQKDKYYAQQGRKMIVDMPESNTWTATVRINVDDTWFSDSSLKKRAEFRVDLVDGSGNPVDVSPAIALIKGGSGSPLVNVVDPYESSGWKTVQVFTNGDKEEESLYVEEDWHTLIVLCSGGAITYYLDNIRLGTCDIGQTDLYPEYLSLSAQNFDRPYLVIWDNCTLYEGSYTLPKMLSSEKQDQKEDQLADKYAERRAKWRESHTVYEVNGEWYDEDEAKEKNGGTLDGLDSKLSKPIPDSYYKY